jgi:hypothetical protein
MLSATVRAATELSAGLSALLLSASSPTCCCYRRRPQRRAPEFSAKGRKACCHHTAVDIRKDLVCPFAPFRLFFFLRTSTV